MCGRAAIGAQPHDHGNLAWMTRDLLARASVRLQTALRLHETGVAMKRAQLRREDPAAPEAELNRRLLIWLRTRPGAEHGDADGALRLLSEGSD